MCRPLPPTATTADVGEVDSACLLLLLLLLVGCGWLFTAVPIPVGSSYYWSVVVERPATTTAAGLPEGQEGLASEIDARCIVCDFDSVHQ